jgi:hypothetical protein
MTNREITVMHLEELSLSAQPAYCEQRFLDAIMYAVSELKGEDPFKDDEDYYKTKCTGECDTTYEIQREFESTIQDAIDELNDVQGKTKEDCETLKRVIRDLELSI